MTRAQLTKSTYIPGQRWVSNTEPEAGLGIVVDSAHRRVTLSFPAIGEQRVYAADNAPLSRVMYAAGDDLRTEDGRELAVEQVAEVGGRRFYQCRDGAGDEHVVDELDLDSFVQFSKPQDRLFSGQIDSPSRYMLRRETLEHVRRLQQSPVLGLLGARVQLLPHQFHIASEVAERHAPRVLLADEVGLGKTIEAGLIVHHQLTTGRASRVLIVVPDSLLHQWLVEMLRRFNLHFTLLDAERCAALERPAAGEDDEALDDDGPSNPFDSAQLVLCGLSLLVENPIRQGQARDAGWDLLVVDEAHHLRWAEGAVSPAYACIERLAAAVPGLLLLTATPEQLGLESHFARLRLLDPARYHDLTQFRAEEASYRQVSALVTRLEADTAAAELRDGGPLLEELRRYLGGDAIESLGLTLAGDLAGGDSQAALDDCVRSLLDRHGTGRVLFRNTREAVAGFPERRLHRYPLAAPALPDPSPGDPLAPPETLLGEGWLSADPRVGWLVTWLGEHRPDKALVICASATTARQLGEYLDLRRGVPAAVFHEGMTLLERDRAAAYFADDEDSAQVLVCSEIGSEGRNFQFVRHLVLFDLPRNPDLLEQRIGRLDRIGQRHAVEIHVPHYDSGAMALLARWYHEGLNAFERVCPVGAAIHEQVAADLEQCLRQPGDQEAATALIATTRALTEAALDRLREGRDRLLELGSCHPRRAEAVIHGVAEAESPQQLEGYMARVFDKFGVDHADHSAHAMVIQPGDHMQCESFPGLLEDGMTVTFQRSRALAREDMHFLSWEHPMVRGVMDMILGGDFGNVTLCTLKLPPLKAGTLLLEACFVLHCAAPRRLQLHRYLPVTSRRVVVDASGKDLGGVLTAAHFDKLGQKVPRGTAQDVVRHTRDQIAAMVRHAEQRLAPSLEGVNGGAPVSAAIHAMTRVRQGERERLEALARVNPNIRQDEIDHFNATTDTLRHHLEKAEWRLDSLRVAVTV